MTFNKKIGGRYAKISLGSLNVHAFIPESYMNLSGIPVAQMVRFFNLTASQLIVVHDELDIPAGYLRIKKGGGTGGHNGLKDIDKHLGTKEYYRLRLGIGRPQDAREVSSFVLKAPTLQESDAIAALFHELLKYQDWMWEGSWDKMQNHFHGLDKNL
jgi:PTH1 family peptidyl-tRNA hydrolase